MLMITFTAMSLAACSFLSYAFVQIYRELMQAGKRISRNAKTTVATLCDAKSLR